LKITKAFCDLHPTSELRNGTTDTVSYAGDFNTYHEMKCSLPECARRYTQDGSYFTPGGFPELRKHPCGINHPVEYMVLTEMNGVQMWACPAEGCELTKPYEGQEYT